jgi:hypothetical protein
MGMQQYCYLRVLVLLSICCVPIVYSASNITTKGTELVDDVGRVRQQASSSTQDLVHGAEELQSMVPICEIKLRF